mmetsp:Transcript_26585/g.54754  ORF Transcript_26585/g.54754 Transcript_26585/m.54754 type:complete len:109 (+) Transcript_26585:548-874(+)
MGCSSAVRVDCGVVFNLSRVRSLSNSDTRATFLETKEEFSPPSSALTLCKSANYVDERLNELRGTCFASRRLIFCGWMKHILLFLLQFCISSISHLKGDKTEEPTSVS